MTSRQEQDNEKGTSMLYAHVVQFGADYGSYRREAGRFLPRLARSET